MVTLQRRDCQIDEVVPEYVTGKEPVEFAPEVAADFFERAHADALAFRTAGPYVVVIRRDSDLAGESFPMSFPECDPSEGQERSSLLAVQRELAIKQAEVMNESNRIVLEAGRDRRAVDNEERDRMRADIARANQQALQMAELVFGAARDQAQFARESAEALMQGDARRRTMRAEEQQAQAIAALASNADVIIPAIASGWMRANGQGGAETLDTVPAFKLIEEFVLGLKPEQFAQIGSLLPADLQIGLMQIYQGKIAAALVPAAAAKIFSRIDDQRAMAIYAVLDPAAIHDGPHDGRTTDGKCPVCGSTGEMRCFDQSDQQRRFATLMRMKENTLIARGEQAMKQLQGGVVAP